jgi:hypothetical protein
MGRGEHIGIYGKIATTKEARGLGFEIFMYLMKLYLLNMP